MKSFPGLPHGRYWVRYEFHASYNMSLRCWLDNGTGTELLVRSVYSPSFDGVAGHLYAEGLVDARRGVVMRVRSGGTFDSGDTIRFLSQISFLRLATGVVRDATTVVP